MKKNDSTTEKCLIRSELTAQKIAVKVVEILWNNMPIEEDWVRIFLLAQPEDATEDQKIMMVELRAVGHDGRLLIFNIILHLSRTETETDGDYTKLSRWILNHTKPVRVLMEFDFIPSTGKNPSVPLRVLCPKASEEIRNLPIQLFTPYK